MATRRRVPLLVRGALVAAACAVVVPASLGGPFSYVSTHGISMAPRFHTGDLAVVRETATYRVGDVVAYRSQMLHTVVLHRIVATDGEHYTFKGDNNSWLDPEHPTRGQFIGKLVVRLPQGGIWLRRATRPTPLATVAFVLVGTGGATVTTRRRRRRRTVGRHAARRRRWPAPAAPRPALRKALLTAGALAAFGGAIGALAWHAPLATTSETAEPAKRSVTFSYGATVRRSAAYDGTTVTAPDPVFRKLTDTVEVRFAYAGAPGRVSVAAELSAPTGWHSKVRLAGPATFTTDRYDGAVRLDLGALAARAQAAAAATGLPADRIDVAVVPRIDSPGLPPFAPALHLTLTPLQASLTDGARGLTVADTATVRRTTRRPGTFTVLGRHAGVATGRAAASGLLLVALLTAAAVALLWRRSARDSEGTAIRRRYDSLLVAVHPMPTPAGRPVVDVADFATLARLAERYGLLVLHWARSDVETFVVQDDGTTYRYRTRAGAVPADVPVG
jgi:signal peptidase I